MDATTSIFNRVKSAYEPDPAPGSLHAPDDKTILSGILRPEDQLEPHLQGRDYYAWYWAFGHAVRPRLIVELGVRFGYSLAALAAGAYAAVGPSSGPDARISLYGFDNESHTEGSCAYAQEALTRLFPAARVAITKVDDLADLDTLDLPGKADIVHCDARYTYSGCKDDLRLALGAVAPGGVILVDDYNREEGVKKAVHEVHAPGGRQVFMHYQGLYVLHM